MKDQPKKRDLTPRSRKPKRLVGFYKIYGPKGRVYDSMFVADDEAGVHRHIKEAAQRIRENSRLTGKAEYQLGNTEAPWNSLEV